MDNNKVKEPNKIELTQEDLDMGKYIYSILLSQPTILMSWGFESPAVIPLGLRFKVNGFKHQGGVEVIYNIGADLFDIYLLGDDNQVKETIDEIYFDQLIEVIDNHVEYIENYVECVNHVYKIETYEEKDI